MRFDLYIDGRRLVYTRNMLDGSGRAEMVAGRLAPPTVGDRLPQPVGAPVQLTFGEAM
ncbi:MAG: hypothetical protein JRG89_22755 [Deltaproteobacteria bacterium]|nr:hypothetical protein [Deltaproteobacteria bacterium]